MQTGYSAVWREDLPRHVTIWECQRCDGTVCEVTSDVGAVPEACPLRLEPAWRRCRS